MAKIGEGDPRWIVSDRADGRNVNAWHWTEKDVGEWAKGRLTTLCENQTIMDTSTLKCKTSNMGNTDGECTVYNRKGKISFLMDMNFSVNWEGEQFDASGNSVGSCKGRFTVPELEHDSNVDKLQIDVTGKGFDEDRFLAIMRNEGRAWLRDRLSSFMRELKDGHGVQERKAAVETNVAKKSEARLKEDSEMTSFSYTLEWRAPPSNIWEALTTEGRVSAYTRSPAKLNPVVGGEFQFLNGTIRGTFTEVEPLKRLAMDWRLSDWSDSHVSKATITLDCNEPGTTTMKLVHTDVPKNDLDRTKQGWAQNFWDPIKMLFGYGYDKK